VPPLVTAAPVTAPAATAGVLTSPNTIVLFNNVPNEVQSGARFSAGFWFPENDNWGLDASYFFLSRRDSHFAAGGSPTLSVFRPVLNATTGNEEAELVNVPGVVSGSVAVDSFTRLWGFDVNLRHKCACGPNWWVDALVGYRHFDLTEGITITENLSPVTGGNIIVSDRFHTRNVFDGPQVGLAGEFRLAPRWTVAGTGKVAVGVVHQEVDIQGNTLFNFPPAAPEVATGGVLALGSNSGRNAVDRFAVMTDVGIKIGYDVTDRLRIYAGYDALYLSSVVRPGEQIDRRIDRAQLPPPPSIGTPGTGFTPALLFRTNDLWVHGVNFGLMYHY